MTCFFFVLTAGESENTSLTIFLRASSFTLLGGVFTVSYLNGALSQCVYVLHPTYFYSLFCFSNPDKMAQQKRRNNKLFDHKTWTNFYDFLAAALNIALFLRES